MLPCAFERHRNNRQFSVSKSRRRISCLYASERGHQAKSMYNLWRFDIKKEIAADRQGCGETG